MVAAARLQRAQSRAAAARPYADSMFSVMRDAASASVDFVHPLLEVREPANMGIIVMTSDRGMAGSFNFNVIRAASELMRSHEGIHPRILTVGKKGRSYFAKRGMDVLAHFDMPSAEARFAQAEDIGRTVREIFESHEVDQVHLVYARFISAVSQRVVTSQLLPVTPPEGEPPHGTDFIFEPRPELLLGMLLPRYVDTLIYRAMLESLASEHGARMTAMRSATDNAAEMIDRLSLDFNRARQAAITREIAEVVAGAEALA